MPPTASETLSATDAIVQRHDRAMTNNYARYPVAMVRGEGCRLWDAEGNEYLDLFSGFGGPVLGHCHPDLVDAVTEQAKTLWHVGNLLHTEPQTRAAEAIGAATGWDGRCFFCHSGADANEAAIKLARLYGKAHPGSGGPRFKVITTLQSFHGRSLATMTATGQPKVHEGFEPLPAGFQHVPFGDLDAMDKAIDERTAAILVEPIQGEGGVRVPADDYLPKLRAMCDAHDLLLMVDEVWTGVGRTGKAFAHQHWGIVPDVMSLAKGVGGGLPVGVCVLAPRVAPLFDWREHGKAVHATTLGGNCLSMAVTARIFEVLQRDNLIQRAATLGEHIKARLRKLADETGVITDIRGKGLFIGIELDPAAPKAWFESGSDVAGKALLEHRLLINATQSTVLRLAPAVTIDQADLDRGLDLFADVLRGS